MLDTKFRDLSDVARSVGVYEYIQPVASRLRMRAWRKAGRPFPPPNGIKRETLREIAREFGLRTLIETGTYKADTVRALRKDFERIVSVELSPTLYAKALHRTRHQGNAQIVLGDSALLMGSIVSRLDGPALFWLDAHHSGPDTALGPVITPIDAEIRSILGNQVGGHVIVIDDACLFHDSVRSKYPPVSVIYSAAQQYGYSVTEAYDMFQLKPKLLRSAG